MEDILSLPFSSSPVVTLVASGSTTQNLAIGDQPLGIPTVPLCSDAASVVGASWPIPSLTGGMFTQTFYNGLDTKKSFVASKNNDNELVDIEIALRNAFLHIRNCIETSETYHWGDFSPRGSWLYKQ